MSEAVTAQGEKYYKMSNEDIDELDSDEEYDDLDSGHDASVSDDNDSIDSSSEETDSRHNLNEKTDKNVIYGNFGWADAMAKVLNSSKPKAKKSIILSKAKKDADVWKATESKENDLSFEIASEIKIKEDSTNSEDPAVVRRKEHMEKLIRRQRRKEWDKVGRVVPSIEQNRDKEKILAKIATRGVVQLFNSVRIQQKTIQDKLMEAGPLERKREKALKSIKKTDFLAMLEGDKGFKANVKSEIKQEDATWNVLRDDFIPEVKMRDWDKQQSSDSEDA